MLSRVVGGFTYRPTGQGAYEIWAMDRGRNIMIRLAHHVPEALAKETIDKLNSVLFPLNDQTHQDPVPLNPQ